MKPVSILYPLTLLGAAAAVDLAQYKAGPGVEAAFQPYLKALYASTEDPAVTTGFSDYFTADGRLIVRGITATGADEIIAFKQRLMPPAGNKHWNHRPNATTVADDTAAAKTFQVLGVIETRYDGGNCSKAYYSTRFTVNKDKATGLPAFEKGNLVLYDDFIVDPSITPTDIPCDTA